MADIELIIEINEKDYNDILNGETKASALNYSTFNAIRNGIPLLKGHWISHKEHCENLGVMPSDLGVYEWCSNCDYGVDVREWYRSHYNYCPNCGAKMVEPQESEDKYGRYRISN